MPQKAEYRQDIQDFQDLVAFPEERVNYHPRSGGLEFSGIGRKGKKHDSDIVERATGCKAPGFLARINGLTVRQLFH